MKPANKAGAGTGAAAEPVERKAGTKRNAERQSTGRERVSQALARVRKAARQRKTAVGCDAGIRYGEHLAEDMIAVPVGPRRQWGALAASPNYLNRSGSRRILAIYWTTIASARALKARL